LATQPGKTARLYIYNRRKKIFSPINFFLLAVSLFLFVQTTFHPLQRNNDLSSAKKKTMKITDETVKAWRLAKLERSEQA